MKNKPLLFLLSVCGLLAISARGENPPAKVIFEQYMNQAQTFADNYPREKAYLHLRLCIAIPTCRIHLSYIQHTNFPYLLNRKTYYVNRFSCDLFQRQRMY